MAVTLFHDMHSGGRAKLAWEKIYIELPEDKAVQVFEELFDRNPAHVTCSCCGEDYSVSEYENMEEATAFHRGCKFTSEGYIEEWGGREWQPYLTVEQYFKQPDVTRIMLADLPKLS